MADRTAEAWRTIPHFYLVREVDAGALIGWREGAIIRASRRRSPSPDLLIKKVATCLQQHPRLNSQWRDGNVQRQSEINIRARCRVGSRHHRSGDSQGRSVDCAGEIAAERSRLVDQAQTEKLRPNDISGGTFTISNLGMYGVDSFQAIVNPSASRHPGGWPHRAAIRSRRQSTSSQANNDAEHLLRSSRRRRRLCGEISGGSFWRNLSNKPRRGRAERTPKTVVGLQASSRPKIG